MGDGICNDMLNNKECLYDLGDCCLKFPALSTNNEYWYGPNIKCVEDSVDFETNIRIIGPLDPTKKFYDKVNRYIGYRYRSGMGMKNPILECIPPFRNDHSGFHSDKISRNGIGNAFR